MNTTRISEQASSGLAHGRVPGRPDLNPLADLLTEYRAAAIGSAPRPSAALAARLDMSATPIAMQRDLVAGVESSGVGVRRAASGLFGLGVTVTIILAAASGAAAVVGAGSAGILPPGAQDAFDQVVSTIVPPGVAGTETTDEGEVPSDSSVTGPAPQTPSGTPSVTTDDTSTTEDGTVSSGNGNANGDVNGTGNANENSNGNGNSENAGNGNAGNGNAGNGNAGSGNSGNGNNDSSNNGNSGNGNSGNGNGNSGTDNSGNGNSGNGNGNGNSGKGNKP
jgi:hypothetical protein